MASYARLNTTDIGDESAILRSEPTRLTESPDPTHGDTEIYRGRRALTSRTNTVNSSVSPHDRALVRKGSLQHSSTRWSGVSTMFGVDSDSIRHSIAPDWHEEKHATDTARPFIYRRQFWRLSRLSVAEWLITVTLCGMIALVLRIYESKETLPVRARQDFNSITTLLALLLGINLAASLRSYAKLLRWRLLSYTYRPLKTFDLVLGCESLLNVVKLLFIAKNDSHPYLPSWTQILCTFWLALNLAMTLFVGMLGLNFNLLSVDYSGLTHPGNAYIPDLASALGGDYYRSLDFLRARGSGAASLMYSAVTTIDHNSNQSSSSFGSLNNGTTQYWFYAFALDYTTSAISRVFIRNDVLCSQHPVIEGMMGLTNQFTYNDTSQRPVNVSYPGLPVGAAGILAMSNMNSTCGERCTQINLFMAGADPKEYHAPEAYYYQCNSTLSPITERALSSDAISHPPELQIPEIASRMLAGSVGWSSYPHLVSSADTFMYQAYPITSSSNFRSALGYKWPGAKIEPTLVQEVQNCISGFNMGAIVSQASIDYAGGMWYTRFLEDAPAQSLTLRVTWVFTIAILAGLPFGQLVALIIVLFLANDTIIRDDSHLAISKIYYNLFKKYDLGERGCMLHVDELTKLMDTKVAYTWRDLPTGSEGGERNGRAVGHVDVYEQPLYRFKISISGDGEGGRKLKSRPEQTSWPQDKYYD